MFKSFKDINISVTTVVAKTNMDINVDLLFESINPTFAIDKKVKNKKAFQKFIIEENPEYGTITSLKYRGQCKGFQIVKKTNKKKKCVKKKRKYFRNSVNIVIYIGKLITIKIPNKGWFHLTGCITDEHINMAMKHVYNHIQSNPDFFKWTGPYDFLHYTARTVMTNIVFNVGFNINREKLDRYMNSNTDFNSLLETSFGYTAVNIKFPFDIDPDEVNIREITFNTNGEYEKTEYITYDDFVKSLEPKCRQKELKKKRRNSFLTFHSGIVIMSGMIPSYMEPMYNIFMDIIINARSEIEETCDKPLIYECRLCDAMIPDNDVCWPCNDKSWECTCNDINHGSKMYCTDTCFNCLDLV